jgi:ABC-type transport system involved in cytochrome bd biosynthesis fused ATPase/permease subunit
VWAIYFENPKDNSLNFTIENHSNNTNFHWQTLADNSPVNQGNVTMKLGETKTVPLSLTNIENKKITIVVTSGEGKKEIYKIIANN